MRFLRVAAIAIAALILIIVLPLWISVKAERKASALERTFEASRKADNAEIEALRVKVDTLAAALRAYSPQDAATANLADRINLGFVAKKSGHGIEWALKRQLAADPTDWGFRGDVNDRSAVNKWAGHRAAVYATEGGAYDWRFGGELRVIGGVSFVLQKEANGKVHIAEYTPTTVPPSRTNVVVGGKTFSLATTVALASSVSASHFRGVSVAGKKLPTPAWEYVYLPT